MAFVTNGSFLNPNQVTFRTDANCDLSNDSRVLSCERSTFFWCNGTAWYTHVGRGELHRVGSR